MADDVKAKMRASEEAPETGAPYEMTIAPYEMTMTFLRKSMGIMFGLLLIGALVLYGIWQEKIITIPYGPENTSFFHFFLVSTAHKSGPAYHFFKDAPFLVMWTRMVGTILALVMVVVKRESVINQAPLWKYVLMAVAASGGSILQFESLKYLCFTVQILAKACKALPVLFWGRYIKGKTYVLVDWVCAWLITIGSIVFLFTGPVDSNYSRARSYWWGLLMLFFFVILDGLVSFYQENLYKTYEASKYNQMLWANFTSVVFCFILSLSSGGFFTAIQMGIDYPVLFEDMSFMGGTAVVGQWCMHSLVEEFGVMVFLAFLNVRLTMSYVMSDLVFAHHNSFCQIIALCVVGFALLFRSFVSFTSWWKAEDALGENEPLVSDKENNWEKSVAEPIRTIGRRLTLQASKMTTGCGCCFGMMKV